MIWRVEKSSFSGTVSVPPSKSHSIRAILFAFLAKGTSTIRDLLPSPDVDAMKAAMIQLGAHIEGGVIKGVGGEMRVPKSAIDAGGSGQVLRFVGAIAALLDKPVTITGDGLLKRQRPVGPLTEALKGLGATVTDTDGYAPITIKGPIRPGKTTLSGEDSQPVSALLMAASLLDGVTEIQVRNSGEKAWVDLTLDWLKRRGVRVDNHQYQKYIVYGRKSFDAFNLTVPGDWSAAAFPLVAALVTGSCLTVEGLDVDDIQGDKAILDVLEKMGAEVTVGRGAVTVQPAAHLSGAEIDLNPIIDSVTILATLACFAKSPTKLYNGAIARKKECDRLKYCALELGKMGADIQEMEDGLIIRPSKLKGADVSSQGCHRMAMSLTVAGMGAEGVTRVHGVECVSKSFPNFLAAMRQVGAKIE